MTVLSRLSSLWRNVVHKERGERELDEEMASYAALLADEKAARGATPEEARRQALIEMGGIEQVKENVREVRMGALLETVWQDARYGGRTLLRAPAFTAAALLALALGIGATTAIFSVVDAVLLRPLPYAHPERLAVVLHRGTRPVAPANFLDWRRQATAFERMGAAEYWQPNLGGTDRPEHVLGLHVTADILPMMGVAPLVGRAFTPEEDQPGREHEVVLSYSLWQRRFGGDPAVIGRPALLDGQKYTVVGVMPRGFEFPPFWATGAQLWAPMPFGERATSRRSQSLRVFARLAPGSTLDEARAQMASITARLEAEFPGTNREVTVRALDDIVVGGVRPALLVLLGAVGFVLLIACANVAHMLLARASVRHKEIALRFALGASRGRVVRQLLTESLLLAAVGGAAGLALAAAGLRALIAMSPGNLPRLETAGLDGRVLLVTAGLSLLTGIVFGLAPALQSSRAGVGSALREGERGSTSGAGRHRLRRLLMGSELALALVLLTGAGLMIRTFAALRAFDPGFRSGHLLTGVLSLTGARADEPAHRLPFYREVLERLRTEPGVVSASAINHLPLAGDLWGFPFHVEGLPPDAPGDAPSAAYRVVLPGYFATMGLPLVRGRDFDERDDAHAPGAIIVNQWLADRYWPGQDPIGKRLTLDALDKGPAWLTVVGVARNAARHDWAAPPENEMYLPLLQSADYLGVVRGPFSSLTLVVRTAGDPALLAPALRSAVWAADASVAVSDVQTMDEVVARSTASPRFYLLLLATFAGVALVLAAVGIYGVMSYSVARRRNEIGIRMALGAHPRTILRLVMGEAVRVSAAGAAAGLVAAVALTRSMSGLLYGVAPTDPATFAAVCALLTLVALVATYVPARRAIRVDPLAALRSE
jgi:putative ABC transport system permease protein